MSKYLIHITDTSKLPELNSVCNKTGNPQSLHDILIIDTNLTKDQLLAFDWIDMVEEESFDELDEVQIQPIERSDDWSLPNISNTKNEYHYTRTGENVDVYVMDTGIRLDHEEFEGRAETIYSFDDKDYAEDDDTSIAIHGTTVASCVGGKSFGVAKKVNIKNVRYSLSIFEGLKAFDTILAHHLNKSNKNPSILNMSFSTTSTLYSLAIPRLVQNGIICVGSSGNNNEHGSRFPAGFEYVISVGATNSSNRISSFSNYGKSIDIFAPGSSVYVAHPSTPKSTTKISGTSFSAPYTAGVLALICQHSLIETAEGVQHAKDILINSAKTGVINTKPEPSPDVLLYSLVNNEPINHKRPLPAKFIITNISNNEDEEKILVHITNEGEVTGTQNVKINEEIRSVTINSKKEHIEEFSYSGFDYGEHTIEVKTNDDSKVIIVTRVRHIVPEPEPPVEEPIVPEPEPPVEEPIVPEPEPPVEPVPIVPPTRKSNNRNKKELIIGIIISVIILSILYNVFFV